MTYVEAESLLRLTMIQAQGPSGPYIGIGSPKFRAISQSVKHSPDIPSPSPNYRASTIMTSCKSPSLVCWHGYIQRVGQCHIYHDVAAARRISASRNSDTRTPCRALALRWQNLRILHHCVACGAACCDNTLFLIMALLRRDDVSS
jgi:hypothetical protein